MKTQIFTRAFQTISFQILLIALAVFGKFSVAHAQFEETVSTSTAALEDAWDGKQIPTTDHFIMLANSDAVGGTKIALTETDVAGAVVMHCLISNPAIPQTNFGDEPSKLTSTLPVRQRGISSQEPSLEPMGIS